MNSVIPKCVFIALVFSLAVFCPSQAQDRTTVSIEGDRFLINGKPTYRGRNWRGKRIEGLLFNANMAQGIFDDLNPESRAELHFPDGGEWNPERNSTEFVEAMEEWRSYGLLAFTLNLQGSSPSDNKNRINSTFDEKGRLRPDYMTRLEQILERADELQMVVILGLFHFDQDQHLRNEKAVLNAVDNITNWIHERGYKHILIEINEACGPQYDHKILRPEWVHELIERVKKSDNSGQSLLAGTSFGGGEVPPENVVHYADFILLHGVGVRSPARITEIVEITRNMHPFKGQPLLITKDDQSNFNREPHHLTAAVDAYVSWGFFDYRREGEGFESGYQPVPVDWGISSARKRAFFRLLRDITGYHVSGGS